MAAKRICSQNAKRLSALHSHTDKNGRLGEAGEEYESDSLQGRITIPASDENNASGVVEAQRRTICVGFRELLLISRTWKQTHSCEIANQLVTNQTQCDITPSDGKQSCVHAAIEGPQTTMGRGLLRGGGGNQISVILDVATRWVASNTTRNERIRGKRTLGSSLLSSFITR